MIELDQIEIARRLIDPVFLDTPLVRRSELDAALGCVLAGKLETANPVSSFKGRGAGSFLNAAVAPGEHVVCASAGNFGLGLAYAARQRGVTCTVFVSAHASPPKVARIREFGADVRVAGADFDAAKLAARAFAEATNARFVEDGAEPAIAAGAGTIGLELCAQVGSADVLLVPVGNGALLAGVGAAVRKLRPSMEIFGVVAAQAPAMKLSFEQGAFIETEGADTIADGIAVRTPVPEALTMLESCVDAFIAVSEAEILRAIRLIREKAELIVEPSAAVGVAAILSDAPRFRGRQVATIYTGANVSADQADAWLRAALQH